MVQVQINSKNVKRRTKRKTKPLTKKESKAVAKIAKSVVKSNLERKYFMSEVYDTVLQNYKIYVFNPLAGIVSGTSTHTRIAERIQNVRLRIKMLYNHLGEVENSDLKIHQDSLFRVLVIRTKRELTQSFNTWQDLTTTLGRTNTNANEDNTLFYQPTGFLNAWNGTIADIKRDNNYEVLYDKVKSSKIIGNLNGIGYMPNGTPVSNALLYGTTAMLSANVKLPQAEYNTDNQYLNNKNTYVVVQAVSRSGLPAIDCGWMYCQYSVQYTDA